MKFRGATALITGAAGGIGRALVLELLADGLQVVAVDREGEAAAAWAAHNLEGYPSKFIYEPTDISKEDAVDRLISRLHDRGLGIDYLVNNAALQSRSELSELRSKQWNLVINVNLFGAFLMSRAFVTSMAQRGFGRVVNISSVYADFPESGQSAYAASKGGLESFSRSLALDYATCGVTANVVSPGLIWHRNLELIYSHDQFEGLARQHVPMQRVGEVDEVTSAIRFLLSDHASYITGQVLSVNGGMYLR